MFNPRRITARQAELLDLLIKTPYTVKAAADKLGITAKTAQAHLDNAQMGAGAWNRTHMVLMWDRYRRSDAGTKIKALEQELRDRLDSLVRDAA